MSRLPGDLGRAGEPTKVERLDEADLALIFACQAWRNMGSPLQSARTQQLEGDLDAMTHWHRLEKTWSQRLRRLSVGASAAALDPTAALNSLRRMHETSMRVDLSRVHPSWCVRALKEESPAVRRVVVASTPEPLRSALRIGLFLDAEDSTGDRPVAPDVPSWACVLWTERLVGGDPARTDDPPAIAVLTPLRRGAVMQFAAWLAK